MNQKDKTQVLWWTLKLDFSTLPYFIFVNIVLKL